MKIKTFNSILIIMLLYMPALAADSNTTGQDMNTFAWETIAEKFGSKEPFCTAKNKDANTINYALGPNVSIITLPSNIKLPKEKAEAELDLSKWQENQWAVLPPLTVQIDPNGLAIDINTIAEGFYKLSVVSDKNDIGKDNNCYAVVATDWKKNLLAWCKKNKEQIETNPDPQLIYSSIVVSHIDNVMELAGKSQTLSGNILSALSKAKKAKTDFEDGNCPDLVLGINKIRLKRFEGASIEEFSVFIPATYDEKKSHPLFLYTNRNRLAVGDNYTSNSGLIEVWWHTAVYNNINWKGFQDFMSVLNKKFNIDENRVYVNGECGNGLAAISLAMLHPDQWAEVSASLGNTYRHMAGNALNLSLIFVKGGHNEEHLVGYYDFAVECFKYHGCRYFKHSRDMSTASVRGKSVPDATRNTSPDRVFYTIESLANPASYWVHIDGREDENFIASIDAIVWGQSILVKTDNIDAYTLNLELAPLDCNRPVEIIENGKSLNFVTGPTFVRKNPKYENSLYVKNKSLHGPVTDVFTDQYAVVWKGDESVKRLAGQLAGSGPCFADANLPANFVNTHNIIFVGRLNESEHFAQIAGKLPVIIEDGKLTANGKVYEGDFGTIFIYPNPINPQRYIVVLSGTTEKAISLLSNVWGQIKVNENADVAIYQAIENNQVKWLICEKFNTIWDWHKDWSIPLTKLTQTYPKWKWHQWIAKALRQQFKADVVILEEPFASAELPDTNELTLRDISRIFKNDWIVKISLKGSDLRELLMVPFNDISSREASAPVIDGASLVKQSANSNVICMNELDNDKFYTVAFPYKAVNGKRMGMVMKNYRLEGKGFFIVLLKEYLTGNTNINLDAELDGIQLNIF